MEYVRRVFYAIVSDGENTTQIKGDNYDDLMNYIDSHGWDVWDIHEAMEPDVGPEIDDLKG